ncbi:MAG: prepilin peptidase [Anaerolineae bacterium]|nr:prepilin peptidase [Anaerolineae bacterium]
MPLLDLQFQPGVILVVRLAITVWLLAAAWSDIRTGRIPNWMTLSVMAVVGLYQLVVARQWLVLVIWLVLFVLWELNFMMAGDAKLLMGLFALFPSLDYALVLAVGGMIELIPLLILRYRSRPLTTTLTSVALRVQNGQLVPTRAELVREGRRLAWVFCLPSIVYVWWFWRP